MKTAPVPQNEQTKSVEQIHVIDALEIEPIASNFQIVMEKLNSVESLKNLKVPYLKLREKLSEFKKIESDINFTLLQSSFGNNDTKPNYNIKFCKGENVLFSVKEDDKIERFISQTVKDTQSLITSFENDVINY